MMYNPVFTLPPTQGTGMGSLTLHRKSQNSFRKVFGAKWPLPLFDFLSLGNLKNAYLHGVTSLSVHPGKTSFHDAISAGLEVAENTS